MPGSCVGVGVVGLLCGGVLLLVFVFKGNLSQSQLIPVVDRPCLALVRQCREKKSCWGGGRPRSSGDPLTVGLFSYNSREARTRKRPGVGNTG